MNFDELKNRIVDAEMEAAQKNLSDTSISSLFWLRRSPNPEIFIRRYLKATGLTMDDYPEAFPDESIAIMNMVLERSPILDLFIEYINLE